MKITSPQAPLSIFAFVALSLLGARPAAAEMNLNVGKLSSNGMEVRNLNCKLESGGLFGSMLIVAELAKHKAAFDKCAPGGAAFATSFTWRDGKTSDVKISASSDAKAEACVAATLKKTKAAVVGRCEAVVLAGNKAKAEAAADELTKAKAPAKDETKKDETKKDEAKKDETKKE
jgi:hypothetical protein